MKSRFVVFVLVVGLSGCNSPTKPTASPPPAVPGAPNAKLAVTVDGRDNAVAILAASDVVVDAKASAPDVPLTYDVDFGDGTTHTTTATATHVYRAAGTFTITARVTDGSGRTASATRDVVVQSVEGAWSNSAFNPQVNKTETRWLTIESQDGLAVRGHYFSSSAQLDRRFTGTLEPGRVLRLRLEDQTIEFRGTIPDSGRVAGSQMPVLVHGGTADGDTLSFVPVFEGQHPDPDSVVFIRGLESYLPFAVRYQDRPDWIPLRATQVVKGVWDDCTDAGLWESSNPQVASFGAGEFRSSLDSLHLHEGTTTLRVTCGDLVGTAPFEVSSWVLRLNVVDGATGQGLPDVDWTRFYSASRSNSSGAFHDVRVEYRFASIWLFRPGYEILNTILEWSHERVVTQTVAMTKTNGTLLLEGDVVDDPASYTFSVPRAGTLQVRWSWSYLGDCCSINARLYCGAVVAYVASPGVDSFEVPVIPSCSYRLAFDQWRGVGYTLRFGAVLLN